MMRRGYMDIEGEEMADYDQIDEGNESDDSQIVEISEMPLPVYGEIAYNRSRKGEDLSYLK